MIAIASLVFAGVPSYAENEGDPAFSEINRCSVQLMPLSGSELFDFTGAAEKNVPVDPTAFARLGITTVKEFNRQMQIVRGLIGKTILGYRFPNGDVKDVVIESVANKGYEAFKSEGITFYVKYDGNTYSHASLRMVLLHANRIQNWQAPISKPFPPYQLRRTVRPSQRPRQVGDGIPTPYADGIPTPYFDRIGSKAPVQPKPPGLTELSRDDLIRWVTSDLNIHQIARLEKSETPNWIDFNYAVMDQLGIEARLVRIRSATTGKEVDGIVELGNDEDGKRLLLISRSFLNDPKNGEKLSLQIFERIFNRWVENEVVGWIKEKVSPDAALSFAFGVTWHTTFSKLDTKKTAPKTDEELHRDLTDATKASLGLRKLKLRSLGTLTENQTYSWPSALQASIAAADGRVEVVDFLNSETNQIGDTNQAIYVRDKNGKPVIFISPNSYLMYAGIAWAEFLESEKLKSKP